MEYENMTKDQLLSELEKLSAKSNEEALQKSEKRYRSLFNLLPYGGELIDTKGNIINCSPSTARMLGYKVSELIGKNITELLDSNSLKVFKKKMPSLLSGKSESAEICMIRKDSVKLNIIRSAIPILNNSNKVEAILAINVDITEQKQSEEALRIERDNLNNIFNAMEDGVSIINQEYDIQYANPALIKDFGIYEGKKCYEYFHNRKEVCHWCKNPEVFAGKTVHWEFTASNNQKTYDLIDTPLKNPDGSISKLEIFRDITERKQAEKKLAESEGQLRSTLMSMSDMVFVLDMDRRFVSCNTFGKELYISPDKFLGKKPSEVMPSNVNKHFVQAMTEIKEGKVSSFEYQLEYPDGIRWYSSKLSPMLHGDELMGAVAVVRNITERKHAEKEIAQKQKLNVSLLNSMPYPIMLINSDRIVLAANKAASDLGAKIGDYCWNGFGHCDYLSEIDKIRAKENPADPGIQCAHCRVDQMFKTNEPEMDPEVSAFNRIWEIYWIPVSDNEFLHYMVDITERKQAEKVMLEASRMEVTATLAAGIAHDFNNLMVGVLGYAELLKIQYDTTPGAIDMINSITYSASKAGDLAQQLLAFARGGKYQPKIINLNDTIQETLHLNERSFPPRIRIERDFDPVLLNILADPTQMSQVVTNLCINSIEAIEKNGRIIITTRNIDIDEKFAASHSQLKVGRHVYLSVEDTGCGMDKNTLLKIFEPFFSTKFQGRGLGLAAVYGIVKNHEGYISAYSEVGRGASFKIYLPAVESEIPPEHKLRKNDISEMETILVIDDEEMVLDITKKILERFGYNVLLAHNGQEAVDLVQSFDGDIHLALLDMGMPILGGSEAFPLIKKARPDIKIIICSGYELDAAAQSLLDAGAELFIQKPFKMQTLFKDIREILDSNKNGK